MRKEIQDGCRGQSPETYALLPFKTEEWATSQGSGGLYKLEKSRK